MLRGHANGGFIITAAVILALGLTIVTSIFCAAGFLFSACEKEYIRTKNDHTLVQHLQTYHLLHLSTNPFHS
jgi:hypothetical protein